MTNENKTGGVDPKTKLQALKTHLENMDMKPLRKEHRKEVRRPLTESELEAIAVEMADHVLKGKELEDQKKEVAKTLGDAQKKEEAIAQALAQKHKDKYAEEPADVLIVANYKEKVRMVFVIETGMMVAKEKLEEKDLQVSIFGDGETAATGAQDVPAPEAAPQAPEALALGYDKGREVIEVEGTVIDDALLQEVAGTMFEPKDLVTQIRMVEINKGINFITTAEKIVLFTENKELMAKAKKAMDQKGYVKLRYLFNPEGRNHEVQMIEESEPVNIDQVLEDLDQEMPDGFEPPDDPDRGDGEVEDPEDGDSFEDPEL